MIGTTALRDASVALQALTKVSGTKVHILRALEGNIIQILTALPKTDWRLLHLSDQNTWAHVIDSAVVCGGNGRNVRKTSGLSTSRRPRQRRLLTAKEVPRHYCDGVGICVGKDRDAARWSRRRST